MVGEFEGTQRQFEWHKTEFDAFDPNPPMSDLKAAAITRGRDITTDTRGGFRSDEASSEANRFYIHPG
jgi:hypothetical protein